MTTPRALYEETNTKRVSYKVVVSGQTLLQDEDSLAIEPPGIGANVRGAIALSGSFGSSQAATATFSFAGKPSATLTDFNAGLRPDVQIYAGYNSAMLQIFSGVIMDVEAQESLTVVSCVGQGRRLEIPFQRAVRVIDNEAVGTVVADLLDDAGVLDYLVDLPAWTMATLRPVSLELQTWGEAINKIAQVMGSPWYEMPTGQIRVELRDPIPSGSAFRQYFAGAPSQLSETDREDLVAGILGPGPLQPPGVTNANAWPRLRVGSVSQHDFPRNVRNRVIILGTTYEVTESDGSKTTAQFTSTADAASPWIPTPPGFIDVTISNELIDTQDVSDDMAVRYCNLYNRLETLVRCAVDGDPELSLGMTVEVIDPEYSGIAGRWFVQSYQWQIDDAGYITTLDLRGGPGAGTSAGIDPHACFQWITAQVFAKWRQVLPDSSVGGTAVIITFDGSCSSDPDGQVVSYAWSDTEGNSGTGRLFTAVYDPAAVSSVDMTLTVTDNDGRTNAITKTVPITTNNCQQDKTAALHIFAAAEDYAMASADGGANWADRDRATAGVSGKFISVATLQKAENGAFLDEYLAIFGTDAGELVFTDDHLATNTESNAWPHAINSILPFSILILAGSQGVARYHALLGTEDGAVLLRLNIGTAFEFQYTLAQFPDGYAVKELTFINNSGHILAVGGNTANPNSLLRVCSDLYAAMRFETTNGFAYMVFSGIQYL